MSQVPTRGRIVNFHLGFHNWPATITRVVDPVSRIVNLAVWTDNGTLYEHGIAFAEEIVPDHIEGDKRWGWPPRS